MPVYVLKDAFSDKFRIQRAFDSDEGWPKPFPSVMSSSLHLFEVIDIDQEEACETTLKRQLSDCQFFCALADDCFLLDPILVLKTVGDVRRWFTEPERPGKHVLDKAYKLKEDAPFGRTAGGRDARSPVQPSRELVFQRSNASYWTICLNHSLEPIEWASATD